MNPARPGLHGACREAGVQCVWVQLEREPRLLLPPCGGGRVGGRSALSHVLPDRINFPRNVECSIVCATPHPFPPPQGERGANDPRQFREREECSRRIYSRAVSRALKSCSALAKSSSPCSSKRMSWISTPARRWPIVSRKKAQTAAWRNSMSISTVGVASQGALKLADNA